VKKNYGNVGSKSFVDLTKGCVKFDTNVATNINLVCCMGFNNLDSNIILSHQKPISIHNLIWKHWNQQVFKSIFQVLKIVIVSNLEQGN
jgi:hypothetical protein